MRKLVLSAALATILAAGTAHASSNTKFSESLTLPANAPSVNVQIILSEDMMHRAENLPEKMRDRSSARYSRDGFGGNGFYGQRDLDRLQERLEKNLTESLTKQGVVVDSASAYTLKVTIVDAKPSHPTQAQMSKQPSLSMQSLSLGGATLQGELVSASGQTLGTVDYGWYENNLRDSFAIGTWSDTHRAFSRFASRTADGIRN